MGQLKEYRDRLVGEARGDDEGEKYGEDLPGAGIAAGIGNVADKHTHIKSLFRSMMTCTL